MNQQTLEQRSNGEITLANVAMFSSNILGRTLVHAYFMIPMGISLAYGADMLDGQEYNFSDSFKVIAGTLSALPGSLLNGFVEEVRR